MHIYCLCLQASVFSYPSYPPFLAPCYKAIFPICWIKSMLYSVWYGLGAHRKPLMHNPLLFHRPVGAWRDKKPFCYAKHTTSHTKQIFLPLLFNRFHIHGKRIVDCCLSKDVSWEKLSWNVWVSLISCTSCFLSLQNTMFTGVRSRLHSLFSGKEILTVLWAPTKPFKGKEKWFSTSSAGYLNKLQWHFPESPQSQMHAV